MCLRLLLAAVARVQAPDWWKTGKKLLGQGSIVIKMGYRDHEAVPAAACDEVTSVLLPKLDQRLAECKDSDEDIKLACVLVR